MKSHNPLYLKTSGPSVTGAFLRIAAVILVNDMLAAAAMLFIYWR